MERPLLNGISSWQIFRSEYAQIHPGTSIAAVGEAWREYRDAGRAGPDARSPSPSPERRKSKSPKRSKSPKKPSKSPPKYYGGLASASLTGIPTELGNIISKHAGKKATRALQVTSRGTRKLSRQVAEEELKEACSTLFKPSEFIATYLDGLFKFPIVFSLDEDTPIDFEFQYESTHLDGTMFLVWDEGAPNAELVAYSVSNYDKDETGLYVHIDEIETLKKAKVEAIIVRLAVFYEIADTEITFDLVTIKTLYQHRLSCARLDSQYATNRTKQYFVDKLKHVLLNLVYAEETEEEEAEVWESYEDIAYSNEDIIAFLNADENEQITTIFTDAVTSGHLRAFKIIKALSTFLAVMTGDVTTLSDNQGSDEDEDLYIDALTYVITQLRELYASL